MKKLLSMFLALSMVLTLPAGTAMAQETHTDIGASKEISAFAPLEATEKSVTIGTSTKALELPQIAESVEAETMEGLVHSMSIVEYNIWVGGTRVNSDNMTDVLGNGTVSCIKTAGSNEFTLTLNGANITGAYTNGYYKSGIYAIGTLNIVLTDGTNNTVTGTTNTGNISCGIYATDQLSFSGNGSLTVSGGTATYSYGLYCSSDYSGGISFWGTGTIIVQGGTAVTESYGMFAKNFIMVLDGTVTATSISSSGKAQATNQAPVNLSSNYSITAGANESGAVTIDSTSLSANYRTYKFLRFTPPAPTAPTATTENATSIMATTATLNGSVNANYGSTTVRFQYGTSTSYGSYVTATQSPVAGSNDTSVSYELTGLEPSTTYHYRTVAVNSAGTTYGSDKTFTTLTLPRVTASNISFSGATGTGGAYKIGDTLTARWNNTSGGDNNSGITSVKMDFSQFGGGTAVTASNSSGIWTAMYTITAGSIDSTNKNVSVTATSDGGLTTTASNTNLTVDNIAPQVTSGNITLSGGSGPGGIFKLGDTVTATWNNTIGGDNNSDTISSVTVNFSAFGGGAMVPATNSSGTWTATYAINPSSSSGTGKNVSVTAIDNAGNRTTTSGSTAATVDTTTTVTRFDLTGKLNAPAKNAVPSSAFASDAQYTGTVTWNGTPAKFLGGTAYSATVMLIANTGYTFTDVAANSFSYSGANVTNAAGSGNTMTLTIAFPTTAAKTLQSIAITTPPNKTVYVFGEIFNQTGMVVKATYDDGTEDMSFNAYVVDKTNPLTMGDTTITLSATANSSITTTQNITINKSNGPAAPSDLAGVAPTTLNGTDGKITGTTTFMEYASNAGFTSATDCTTTEITGLTAGTYYVRVKATTSHEAGAHATVNVPAGVSKITVPTAITGLKWNNSLQGGVSGGTGYTLSGDYQATEVGSYTATATLQPGYAWNDSTTTPKTITWSIAKAVGPAAPTDLAGAAPTTLDGMDGKITGTTTLMEYSSNTGFTSATDCTSTEITGLVAGTYYVRVKATTTHEAGAYATVIVPAGVTKIAIPTAYTGLKWNNSLQGGVSGGTGYTLSGDYQATEVGSYTATATLQPGYVWNDNTTTPKTISWSIAKANGPAAPTDLAGVAPTTLNGTDGKISGTTTLMEYSSNTGFTSATDCTTTEITGLTAGTHYVRVKATTSHEAGAYATITVPEYVPDALTGIVTISGALKYGQTLIATYGSGNNTGTLSYQWKRGGTDGIIIGTNSNTYTIEAADINQTLTCLVTSDLQAGSVYGNTSATIGKADGPTVSGVSTEGCTTVSNNDGKLTGMTTAMEYKKIGDANYTTVTGSAITVTGSAITGLTNGDYLVRVAETDTHYAGADSIFTVGAFIPAPTYTINGTITSSETNNGIAGAVVQLKSGSGNIGSSVPTDSNGAYTISNVPAGTYTILVTAIGYDSGTISSFDLSGSDVINQNLTLTKTIIFIPVTDITMNSATSIQVNTNLILTGTMTPGDATNRTMTWSVENANGTGATITGDIFRATSAGTATVKASVVNGLTTSSDYTKTFTITVTAAPIPVPDPAPGPGPTPSPVSAPSNAQKAEGTVEKTQQQEDGAPAVNVNNNSNELKTSVLTPQEQEMVASGEKAKVILKVTDIGTSVRDEEKKLIQEKLAIENGVLGSGASDIPILYVDLSLYKQVGSQEQTKVTETNGNISISIEVPKSFWNMDITKNRAFYVIRIHDGKVTRIEGSYDAQTHLFTFESDRFSTYALTYQDTSGIQSYHDFHHLQLTAKADKTSQTLSYKRIANVDGYLIYGEKCGEEMTKLAEVSADITSYTVKKLKQGTYYKYQVKAYRIIDGKQVVIMTSKVIHSITESKKYGNPTKVTAASTSVKLTVGKSATVACQVVLPKNKKLKEHTADIRYESSNQLIATVNSKGKITAKAKGSCYVYAYAQNGVYKSIKVTVE